VKFPLHDSDSYGEFFYTIRDLENTRPIRISRQGTGLIRLYPASMINSPGIPISYEAAGSRGGKLNAFQTHMSCNLRPARRGLGRRFPLIQSSLLVCRVGGPDWCDLDRDVCSARARACMCVCVCVGRECEGVCVCGWVGSP